MGIKAIDDINRNLKLTISYLREGKVDRETFKIRGKDSDAILYTFEKVSNDLYFLSEKLAQRGYEDKSFLGRLKQAFIGIFGGF
jgi:hypothetical protein